MGTPDFAVPCLKRLIDLKYNVVGVFTQPDKPKGRGYKLTPPPVKELALEAGIPVYQPEKMRDGTAYSILTELAPDMIIAVAYGKILPKDILDLPKYGCVNVHGSLLPKYRGAAPIQWSVINGDKTTGVTSMKMDVGMDTGNMLLKLETPIGEEETGGELFDRLALLGADCLEQTLDLFGDTVPEGEKQNEEEATYAEMLTKEHGEIDFTLSAKRLHDLIRGTSPWPSAYTWLDGSRIKLHRAAPIEGKGAPGELLDSKKLIIACGEGALQVFEVQPEGGKRMNAEDYLRGKRLEKGVIFG
ncbi:MAG: methionyl-tRNA formyltransferase [Oscillospiraceae bacterium]|nr:methionyl-tRNA formyltransferase [Oscillospiraceae bacterium]